MRKLIVIIILALGSLQLKAGHIRGGQITWECIASGPDAGKFIFTVKILRTCDPISAAPPPSFTIQNSLFAQYGGPATIVCPKTTSVDISRPCYNPSQQIQCGFSSVTGRLAYEENTYVSAAVQINGVPDSAGSPFYINDCCWPVGTKNIPGGSPIILRAVMYPYLDPVTNTPLSLGGVSGPTCYDNSPQFAEPFNYFAVDNKLNYLSNLAFDPDMDVVYHHLAPALMNITTPLVWNTGYSTLSQLPDAGFNPLNVPMSMDSATGILAFKTVGGTGGYTNSYKVASYRHGQKVAEVFRDFTLLIDTINSNTYHTSNTPPDISFKNNADASFSPTYADTFNLGDFMRINIAVGDPNLLPGFIPQATKLKIYPGPALDNFFNPMGCSYTSCATLDTVNPAWTGSEFYDTLFYTVDFVWQPQCDVMRANNAPYLVKGRYKTFAFTVGATDNSCPAPASRYATFYITIRDTAEIKAEFESILFTDSIAELKWSKYTGSVFNAYNLYRSDNMNGPFQLLDSITNVNTLTYYDSTAISPQSRKYYRLITSVDSTCLFDKNTIGSIVLNADTFHHQPRLQWNTMYKQFEPVLSGYYIVEVDSGLGWQKTDSIVNTNLSITWTDEISSCLEILKYRILARDMNNSITYRSNEDSVRFYHSFWTKENPICSGDSIFLAGAYRSIPGFYTDSSFTSRGCKDITRHQLIVNPVYQVLLPSIDICEGDSALIDGLYRKTSGIYNLTLSSVNSCDSILSTELNVHEHYDLTTSAYICKGDSMLINGVYQKEPGFFQVNAQSKFGCDSMVDLSLTYRVVNTSISRSNNTLAANVILATYQWIDCITMQPIAGETNRLFNPTVNSTYAVIVTQDNCSDTSDCVEINSVGLTDYKTSASLRIFPNPAHDRLYFTLAYGEVQSVKVVDVTGRLVVDHNQTTSFISLGGIRPGTYVMLVETSTKTYRQIFVKQE